MSDQSQQLELPMIQKKEDVFYVRCRPRIKKLLLFQMHKDKFSSMADWFEQFVLAVLDKKKLRARRKKSPKSRKKNRKSNVTKARRHPKKRTRK